MMRFRKIWDETTNGFIFAHKELVKDYKTFHALFMQNFPDSQVTFTAFKNQCSRLGVVQQHNPHVSTKKRPLYAEHCKKGYVRIKIAEPNIWVSKSKWVYMETHPWEDFTERSNYIFLDGNNRNFSPENIERVELKYMAQFNYCGGCVKDNPELTRLHVIQAKLKLATLDAGERLGLTADGGGGRVFIAERNRKAREYNSRPERKKVNADRARLRRQRMKVEEPERYAQMQAKHKAYAKEWHKRKKEM